MWDARSKIDIHNKKAEGARPLLSPKEAHMLKKLISFLLIALLLVLTSCGNGGVVETTTDAITTVDPIAAYHEKRNCFKLIVNITSSTFKDKPEKIVDASATDKESFFRLIEKSINTFQMYGWGGAHICIEWVGIVNADAELISKIESELSIKISSSHFSLRFENFDYDCEKVSEFLYYIVSNENVAKVHFTDMCPKLPVTH